LSVVGGADPSWSARGRISDHQLAAARRDSGIGLAGARSLQAACLRMRRTSNHSLRLWNLLRVVEYSKAQRGTRARGVPRDAAENLVAMDSGGRVPRPRLLRLQAGEGNRYSRRGGSSCDAYGALRTCRAGADYD